MLDVRRLRVLQEVARQGSLSEAARVLDYSQPAISHHIRRLEEEAGTRLVTRLGRGVELTEGGKVLVEHAGGILARLAAAEKELAAITDLSMGHVRVVAFPSANTTLVPRALRRLRSRHPAVEVSVAQGMPPESLAHLRAGDCDLVLSFTYKTTAPDDAALLRQVPLLSGRLNAVLPLGHELGGEEELSLAALQGETWIAGCLRCHRGLIDACAAVGFTPETKFGIADLNAIQSMVAAGLGVALVPALVLEAFQHPQIVVCALANAPTWEVSAVVPADGPSPATIAMLEALQAAALAITSPVVTEQPASNGRADLTR